MYKLLRRTLTTLLAICLLAALPGSYALADSEIPTTDVPAPVLAGEAGFLLEVNTGTVLFSQNGDEILYPASTTKIMTALVVIENTENSNDIVTFSRAAVNGISADSSRIGARVGEELTVEQALYGLMLKSGNDCSVALAEYVAGSEAAFAELMNKRAAEIGCTNTHFVNAHGLHDDNHYTTAHDLALIMKTAIQNDVFRTIDSTVYYKVPSTNLRPEGLDPWTMSNKMMNPRSDYYYEGVVCGKTGFTDEALNTLVTCASRGNSYLIAVVMKCQQTHYDDTEKLFNYGFGHFSVLDLSSVDSGISYNMDNTNFFGSLENVIGHSSFFIKSGSNYLLLPNSIPASELETEVIYETQEEGAADADGKAFATLRYLYQGSPVGETTLEIAPREHDGFDFEQHENPVPETETQVVPEETKAIVIDPKAIALGVTAVIALILLIVFLIRFFSPRNRRRRQARRKRRLLAERRRAADRSAVNRMKRRRRRRDDWD